MDSGRRSSVRLAGILPLRSKARFVLRRRGPQDPRGAPRRRKKKKKASWADGVASKLAKSGRASSSSAGMGLAAQPAGWREAMAVIQGCGGLFAEKP